MTAPSVEASKRTSSWRGRSSGRVSGDIAKPIVDCEFRISEWYRAEAVTAAHRALGVSHEYDKGVHAV